MPTIDRIPTLQYMGSKSRMLEEICTPVIYNQEIQQVVDLFAGTGSVGYALAPYKKIISNDIEYYSYVLNSAILNGCQLSSLELEALLKSIDQKWRISKRFLNREITAEESFLASPLSAYEEYATFSHDTPSVFHVDSNSQGFEGLKALVQTVTPGAPNQEVPFPCLFVTYFSNAYFGIKQCCQIDAIASTIAELPDEQQRFTLLAALMTATSATASSTTHFAQFLTVKNKNTFRNIKEKRSTDIIQLFKDALTRFEDKGLLNKADKKHDCFNMDFEGCLRKIDIDEHTLVYADPPYFKEHYSRYYHVLNTMCLYDYPQLAINPQNKQYAVGRYRADRNISDFGKRSKALFAFGRLINACADRKANLLISYSENSLVKIYELLRLTKTRYSVSVKKVTLKHSSQGRATESDQTVKEFLFHCSLPDSRELEIEKTANSIRTIKPVVDNPGGFIHNYMARKPYNVVSAIIEGFSKPKDFVYDPMFGSGTVLIEGSKLGRRVIGTDINPIAKEICSISLSQWDLAKINALIDQFVKEVEVSCSDVYTFTSEGEMRVIERCHFDYRDNGFVPTAYWYKTIVGSKWSGRKKCDASTSFRENYDLLRHESLARLHDRPLIPNSRIAIKEGATVFSYFCNRNIIALDRILSILDQYKNNYGYEVLRLLVSSSINLIKLSDKKASSQMPYWLPRNNATSRNAVFIIQQKAKAMKDGLRYLQDHCQSFIDNGKAFIHNDPAQRISCDKLPDDSVDLVVTDPPYTDQVPYLEYNQLWLYLLDMDGMVNFDDELVVSDAPRRNKDQQDFDTVFSAIIERTAKCLREMGVFVMFYHTFDLKSWSNLLTMMRTNGLKYVYQIPTPTPRKSFKTIMSPRSTLDGNYVLFFVKDPHGINKTFGGDLSEAVDMAIACAERIIRSQENVTTQDLYDQGMLKEAFEEGYLETLSERYRTFADIVKYRFKYENGYWEVSE